MFALRNVSKSFDDRGDRVIVANNLSWQLEPGQSAALLGESGNGKTTLLNIIAGLEKIDCGQVMACGKDISSLSEKQLSQMRRDGIGLIFQKYHLVASLSVWDNAALQARLAGKFEESYAAHLLERLGISQLAHRLPHQLSGGQQQRVAIARALCMMPKIMLFDEPTSALDPEMIAEVLDVIEELADSGMTMICVTHEMGFARQVADMMLFMDHGKIVETGPPKTFFTAPKSDRCKLFLSQILRH